MNKQMMKKILKVIMAVIMILGIAYSIFNFTSTEVKAGKCTEWGTWVTDTDCGGHGEECCL
jgi:hypothetical protein